MNLALRTLVSEYGVETIIARVLEQRSWRCLATMRKSKPRSGNCLKHLPVIPNTCTYCVSTPIS